jgi:hypothetical protein
LITSGFALFLSIPLAGCGAGGITSGPVYPVKGQVLLSNGKPLTSGKVIFLPKAGGMTAHGEITADGTFGLKTADDREGAPAGEYKVRIEPSNTGLTTTKGGSVEAKNLPFSADYMDEDGETGLTATVKTEPTQLEPFKLEAAGTKSKASRAHKDNPD